MISIFTERALKGRRSPCSGDGEQTRDFIYVADLVDFLVQALEATAVEPGR